MLHATVSICLILRIAQENWVQVMEKGDIWSFLFKEKASIRKCASMCFRKVYRQRHKCYLNTRKLLLEQTVPYGKIILGLFLDEGRPF